MSFFQNRAGALSMIERIERVVCDVCSASGPEVPASESAREAAKAEGWTSNGERDLCPRCAAKKQNV